VVQKGVGKMPAEIIDGRKIASEIQEELRQRVDKLKEKGVTPGLVAVVVGEDPGTLSYLRGIAKGADPLGIFTETVKLPENVTQEELERKIEELNQDPKFHGIILGLPLPKHLNALRAESAVSPDKDVDGTNPVNTGKLLLGEDTFFPSTPYGVQELLVRSGHSPERKRIVICGRSNIVGKPLMGILVQKKKNANATITVCHTGTEDLPSVSRQADILVAAMGRAKAITADMIKEGAVVIDVGVNRVKDPETGKFKLVGDVDFEAVKEKAGAITPVPGGTGPVTSAMLMANTVKAAEKQTVK
jgi:methylenetetrahydrofolate dehydrogenase (NADP+)/methenyltetrahydrofolate cyclohydrolase